MIAESVRIDAALIDDIVETVWIESSQRREVDAVTVMAGVAVKGVWEALVRERGFCHFTRHGRRMYG